MEKKSNLYAMDFIDADHLEVMQLDRMKKIIRHAFNNVEFYRNRMRKYNLTPDSIKSLDDVEKLPFMVKQDLRDTYPFGLLAVPQSEVVRLHASSGTTGKPIVVAYTKEDLKVWTEVVHRALANCGLTNSDIVQISYGYGLFTGGLGAHYGAEDLGATVVPTSGGNTRRQIMLMRDFGVNAICCTPSYFIHMIDEAAKSGIDLRELPIRAGIFGAEPWTAGMRKYVEENAGIEAFDIYGLSEIIGPGVAIECPCHSGLHVYEDHFYPEIIDPDTGESLPDGEYGELVLTTLSKYAMPMIRYRTRDLTRIIPGRCACGRTIRRIDRISSRSDDMFIIRGVNVFPSQIEAALLSVRGTTPNYLITLTNDNRGMDNVAVEVELSQEKFNELGENQEPFRRQVSAMVESVTGIRIAIALRAPGTLPRSEGKAKRVVDNRTRS
ncbi:MAG: phenylacetate--CoA ligase [Lentisphaeria bacterium]|nr:phenylacetate--CoA ligase [Lentisphaeria bacterium]